MEAMSLSCCRRMVKHMTYTKPQIFPVGKALDAIESSLDKNCMPVDSGSGIDLTAAPAYQADK